MNTYFSRPSRVSALQAAIAAAFCSSLVACGGGGDGAVGDGGGEATPLPALSLQGTVQIDQAISQATVCVDLNGNAQCDAGEPVSAATGADGKYSLTYQPKDAAAATQFNASPLLANVPAGAVDAAQAAESATGKAFTMAAPAGKGAQINPLTTLVQLGVAGGQSLDAAEAAVALQLKISRAELYDYQSNASSASAVLPDTARTAAKVTAYALELGAPLQVTPSSAAAAPSRTPGIVNYVDAQNYAYRERITDGVVDANGMFTQFEVRTTKSAGVLQTGDALYPTVSLTSSGWKRCDDKVARLSTRGNPTRSEICAASTLFYGFGLARESVAGKSMAEVLTALKTGDSRLNAEGVRYDPTMAVDPTLLGDAKFPEGAEITTSVSVQLIDSPAVIQNSVSDFTGFATLAELIAGRPASGVALPAGRGTAGGMGLLDATHVLRVAFIDASQAQFYVCDSVDPYATYSNCKEHSKSAYKIETVHGESLLKFETSPGQAYTGTSRGYAQMGSAVYTFRQPVARATEEQAVSYNQRPNGVAWAALKTALALN
jgi:hypothetical protein